MNQVTNLLISDFKTAMRRQAATVTLVTTKVAGRRHGMAATAVSSVTANPPTLLVCVNRSASMHDPIVESARLCVNLLAAGHEDLVASFSGREKGEARFTREDWTDEDGHVPFLTTALANMFCDVKQTIAYGSHSIFIGEVTAIRLPVANSPLVYHEGAFCSTVSARSHVAA